ncbi:GFA family protein [Halomonas sp. OfavH-34-E]|uniref:GFA family protein n=1 Tax=Halomonas litopenaei TaxID=2109328 RepID=A0ABX5IYQ1_9GAMM|nr:GFA family protein [Gammaproteobacteria bacterium]PTL90593.1 GFA family protein [Halomonas sp. SYSU XM8]PTL94186.1 GFA family protein [Halomonas litopenaei]
MLKGHCFCGNIIYEAGHSPSFETNCLCSICRRTSGAPLVTWFTVPIEDFHFISGSPSIFKSSAHGTRTFCPDCGTPLTFSSTESPSSIDVTTCTLDDPENLPPKDLTMAKYKLSWFQLGDDLPVYLEGHEGEDT